MARRPGQIDLPAVANDAQKIDDKSDRIGNKSGSVAFAQEFRHREYIMKTAALFVVVPLLASVAACAATTQGTSAAPAAAPTAHAKLAAGDGSARGTVTVTQAGDGLHVLVKAQGLTPGIHAVHIHTTGVCTGPDFTSAGGHWNPTAHQHGKDNPQGMHMGDMPNMLAGSDGVGEMEYIVHDGLISDGANPLLDADGAAVVIHAQADDNKSDPAGNAGGRVACGVLSAG